MSYTPGPWSVSTETQTIIKHDIFRDGSGRGVMVGSACGYEGSGFFPDDATAVHNSRLIAAAPELLEALEALIDEQNGPPLLTRERQWNDAMKQARAAIKKARGEA